MLLDAEFLATLRQLEVVARRRLRGHDQGTRRSPKRGTSAEFADHRAYSPGDDLRHLDWHAYHRLGELVLKLYAEERNLELVVLLDTSASMDLPGTRKRDMALMLAAALAYVGMASLERVRVQPIAAGLAGRDFRGTGRAQAAELFGFLEAQVFAGTTDLARAMSQATSTMSRRSLVLVISDFYDLRGLEPALQITRGRRDDVGLIHVYDPVESDPQLEGELELVDRETNQPRQVVVTRELAERYRQVFARHRRRVADTARRLGAVCGEAPTSRGLIETVTDLIATAGVLG